MSATKIHQLDRVVIRFAGDSGDGMQLTGDRFTSETAAFGNDLSTLPNFPAEIRAPAGTLPGVSSFQLHFADHDILTPGDQPDVLIAMNPAALRANLADLPKGATIVVDNADFTARALKKVGYDANPLEDGSLHAYKVHALDLSGMTAEALKDYGLSRKEAGRSKNMFALGLLSWMYGRPIEKIQANMDPHHRDRIAFLRICSGQFEPGMTVRHHRLEQELRINRATTFLAQDREGVTAAYPGDIIGLYNHGTIKIGDSFSTGEALQFTGVPSFAPEHFRKVHIDDPFRAKHLAKGLKQLSEEGAIQVFRPLRGSTFILGAVGELQFDVTVERLKSEYNVAAHLGPVGIQEARWIEAEDPALRDAFENRFEADLYTDAEGDLAYLARNAWRLQKTIEDWPEITFRAAKEHAQTAAA